MSKPANMASGAEQKEKRAYKLWFSGASRSTKRFVATRRGDTMELASRGEQGTICFRMYLWEEIQTLVNQTNKLYEQMQAIEKKHLAEDEEAKDESTEIA